LILPVNGPDPYGVSLRLARATSRHGTSPVAAFAP
jgi:hypothetical protein